MPLSAPWVTTAVSKLSARVPDRLVTAALAATYPRFEPELARLADFCPDHGTALDIGAWYGPWSRALARRVDRVIAVEPNPAVARVLTRTAPPNVDVIRAAITDTPGEGVLYIPTPDQEPRRWHRWPPTPRAPPSRCPPPPSTTSRRQT